MIMHKDEAGRIVIETKKKCARSRREPVRESRLPYHKMLNLHALTDHLNTWKTTFPIAAKVKYIGT